MASWVCHICGFRHGDHEETCFGCHHSGSSLEHYIDCPKCGRETKAGSTWCESCQESLEDADLDDDPGGRFDEDDPRDEVEWSDDDL